jgi:uncharacterized protein (DUF1015 family)
MVKIKPFRALRPPKQIAKQVSARPYDVMNSAEAKAEAGEKSLLHITKPEIDFEPMIDEHSQQAYDKAVENFKKWQELGWLVLDSREKYYIYSQTMNGRVQYGLVACANVDDYLNGKIKKHELTRKDKEDDRMVHVKIQNANMEPVFFAYPDVDEMNEIVDKIVTNQVPVYSFVADEDGFGHDFWVIDDDEIIGRITEIFASVPALYVADGHHRTAAAARVGEEKRDKNKYHTGKEEYNYFMAVIFPASNLMIIDYNRLIKDLNGLSREDFIAKLEKSFVIEPKGKKIYKPDKLRNFSMYIDREWYSLTAKQDTYNDADPIGALDVTILSNIVFDEILNLGNLRTSNRIDFVGGIRGLEELKRRVDSGEMAAAFALYPVSMKQLIDIADTGNIMPPKTTWFEPKLRSGLAIHKLD